MHLLARVDPDSGIRDIDAHHGPRTPMRHAFSRPAALVLLSCWMTLGATSPVQAGSPVAAKGRHLPARLTPAEQRYLKEHFDEYLKSKTVRGRDVPADIS